MKLNKLDKEIKSIHPQKHKQKSFGKEEFFLLMHNLIKNQNSSFPIKIILIIIEMLQLSAFNFSLCV